MLELDKNTFEAEVLQASGIVFVDFYGEDCAPCIALMPHIHDLEASYGDRIKFCAIDIGRARRLAFSQKIMGMPAVALYENGVKVDSRVKNEATPENVEAMIVCHI